jgi:hypothetical protein
MLLDVNNIVMDLVAPREGSTLYDKQFTAPRLSPCCNATGLDGARLRALRPPRALLLLGPVHGWP